ncbi:MAG: PDZ domain-containing protein [Deltaproteobacteria bacterium]|nr:MAG: PDZ domain-containing protein [Deltaproteobacteria bacterium]
MMRIGARNEALDGPVQGPCSRGARSLRRRADRRSRMGSTVTMLRIAATGLALLVGSATLAAPPEQLWTEKTWAKPLDPDAPVSMRAFSRLAKELSPAVVNITIHKNARPTPSFFGADGGTTGLGTGFIIHKDGYVLTNNHVVRDTDEIQVRLANDHVYTGHVVGTYPQLDVALLKLDTKEPLAVAPLGHSEPLEIGEWVIAIGNPFGLSHTVTAGIVSAKGRRDIISNGEPMYARYIQTDASINPGNSGGPLINIRGEVVGINTAISASGQGIGFAVPIDMVKKILPQLATGKVSRSFLGVRVDPVARELAEKLHMDRATGALVREVISGTPADKAGVRPGDVILVWDDKPIDHWEDLPWLASTTPSGKKVVMIVNRSGKTLELGVQVTEYPSDPWASAPAGTAPRGEAARSDLGMKVAPVDATTRTRLGLSEREGVVVVSVHPGSTAEQLGMRPGDVITQVNYDPIQGPDGFTEAVDRVGAGDILSFTIRRGNRYLFKAFTR